MQHLHPAAPDEEVGHARPDRVPPLPREESVPRVRVLHPREVLYLRGLRGRPGQQVLPGGPLLHPAGAHRVEAGRGGTADPRAADGEAEEAHVRPPLLAHRRGRSGAQARLAHLNEAPLHERVGDGEAALPGRPARDAAGGQQHARLGVGKGEQPLLVVARRGGGGKGRREGGRGRGGADGGDVGERGRLRVLGQPLRAHIQEGTPLQRSVWRGKGRPVVGTLQTRHSPPAL